ncbi:alpha-(1,3)-fucosyltransferase C-like [Mytilus edulis]|uniref:alpha-(1,3)-fucosyltransferase C-like n=1 Tax=Mytilus edulis TaxID=6550 RepID=UPI0039EE435D
MYNISLGQSNFFQNHASIISSQNYVIKFDKIFNKEKQNIKVLLWTEFFGKMGWVNKIRNELKKCNCSCIVTGDKKQIEFADVVVFHLLDLWFFKTFPRYREEHQLWVIFIVEPPPHIFSLGLVVPNMSFNWTMSYRQDSDIVVAYGDSIELTGNLQSNFKSNTPIFEKKTKLIASVIGNCYDDARRYKKIKELQKIVSIDQYGECGYLSCPRNDTCAQILSQYKFKIAFENSHCRDYVSEKFWSSLNTNLIPVVAWRQNQVIRAPPNSYINVYDFKTTKEAGEYLIKVSKNKTLYYSYFKWKGKFKINHHGLWSYFYSLCEKVKSSKGFQSKVVKNVWNWVQDDTCSMWSISSMIRRRWDRLMFNMNLP